MSQKIIITKAEYKKKIEAIRKKDEEIAKKREKAEIEILLREVKKRIEEHIKEQLENVFIEDIDIDNPIWMDTFESSYIVDEAMKILRKAGWNIVIDDETDMFGLY